MAIHPTSREMAELRYHKKVCGQGEQNGYEAGVADERARMAKYLRGRADAVRMSTMVLRAEIATWIEAEANALEE